MSSYSREFHLGDRVGGRRGVVEVEGDVEEADAEDDRVAAMRTLVHEGRHLVPGLFVVEEVVAPETDASEDDEDDERGREDPRPQAQQSRGDGETDGHRRPDQRLRQEDRPPDADEQLTDRRREAEDENERDPSAIVLSSSRDPGPQGRG